MGILIVSADGFFRENSFAIHIVDFFYLFSHATNVILTISLFAKILSYCSSLKLLLLVL